MDAGVVELDSLTDAVGTRAQNDHLRAITGFHFSLGVVAGVVVGSAGRELSGTGVHRLVDRPNTQRLPHTPHHRLWESDDAADLCVREAVPLRYRNQVFLQHSGRS